VDYGKPLPYQHQQEHDPAANHRWADNLSATIIVRSYFGRMRDVEYCRKRQWKLDEDPGRLSSTAYQPPHEWSCAIGLQRRVFGYTCGMEEIPADASPHQSWSNSLILVVTRQNIESSGRSAF